MNLVVDEEDTKEYSFGLKGEENDDEGNDDEARSFSSPCHVPGFARLIQNSGSFFYFFSIFF